MKPFRSQSSLIFPALLVFLMILMAGCAGKRMEVKSYEKQNFLHFSQLREWDETKSLNDHVIYVNEGDAIPLALAMDTDFMDFKQDHIDIVAKKKIYFRIKMPDNLTADEIAELNRVDADRISRWSDAERREFFKNFMIYISTDAAHWAPLSSIKSWRKVFGFQQGTISFGIAAGTTEGLEAGLNIKTIK